MLSIPSGTLTRVDLSIQVWFAYRRTRRTDLTSFSPCPLFMLQILRDDIRRRGGVTFGLRVERPTRFIGSYRLIRFEGREIDESAVESVFKELDELGRMTTWQPWEAF